MATIHLMANAAMLALLNKRQALCLSGFAPCEPASGSAGMHWGLCGLVVSVCWGGG